MKKHYGREEDKGLYFHSRAKGSGKTMLMCGIANHLLARHQVKFVTTGQIICEIKATWDRQNDMTESRLLHDLSTAEILIVDDFGAEKTTDWVNSVFYGIINDRYNKRKVTMFTANEAVEDNGYDERIQSRVQSMTLQVEFPEESVRGAIAKEKNREEIERILKEAVRR